MRIINLLFGDFLEKRTLFSEIDILFKVSSNSGESGDGGPEGLHGTSHSQIP
jgi:hypothetical protein